MKNLRSGLRPTSSGFILSANIIAGDPNSVNPHDMNEAETPMLHPRQDGVNRKIASLPRFTFFTKHVEHSSNIRTLQSKIEKACVFVQTFRPNLFLNCDQTNPYNKLLIAD